MARILITSISCLDCPSSLNSDLRLCIDTNPFANSGPIISIRGKQKSHHPNVNVAFGAGGHIYLYEVLESEAPAKSASLPKYMSTTSLNAANLSSGTYTIELAPFSPKVGEEDCRLKLTYKV